MSALRDACTQPFSNGTERYAWEENWCAFCEHDHGCTHDPDAEHPACDLLLLIDLNEDMPENWPEAWLPEPDDGRHFLPSRLVCLNFKPCHLGQCEGDPHPTERAAEVAEVTAYWKERRDD